MSLERLQLLENYFSQKGWILEEDPEQDLSKVIDQKFSWRLRHNDPKIGTIALEFWLCDHLGRRTEDLNDLFYCDVTGRNERLYFSKLNSSDWNEDYKQFVDRLTHYTVQPTGDLKSYYITEIDAAKCLTYKSMFVEFSAAFGFPHTGSNSYHAVLMDYMRDLGWLRQRNYKLTVINKRKAEKHPDKMQELQETLEAVRTYWDEKKIRSGNRTENDFILEYID